MLWLVIGNGPFKDARYAVVADRVTIGRVDCDITIELGPVTSKHCVITWDGAAHYLADLNSKSGTYLNGQQLKASAALKDGDRIGIAELILVVRYEN